MNKKYYTPNISDLHDGYECELKTNYDVKSFNGEKEIWRKTKIEYKDISDTYYYGLWNLVRDINDGYQQVRTPYLDAEQIEKEGWTPLGVKSQYFPNQHSLGKDNLWLVLDTANEIPAITIILQDPSLCKTLRMPESFRVCLNCPSINEFRTILNLVNIK